MAYATRDHVFLLGLSAQAFLVRPRPVVAADVDLLTGTFRLKGHGLSTLDLILFENVTGGTLPLELSSFTYYTPIVLGNDLFRVATVQGGSTPIAPLTTAGSGWGVSVDPWRRLDMHLEARASEIDECLTAHEPPLQPDPQTGKFPWQVIAMNAEWAALTAVTSLQVENAEARKAVDRLLAKEEQNKLTRADWKAGKPVQPRPTDKNTLPDNAPRAGYGRPPVGWSSGLL